MHPNQRSHSRAQGTVIHPRYGTVLIFLPIPVQSARTPEPPRRRRLASYVPAPPIDDAPSLRRSETRHARCELAVPHRLACGVPELVEWCDGGGSLFLGGAHQPTFIFAAALE